MKDIPANGNPSPVRSLDSCPKCQGVLQATVKVYLSKIDGCWQAVGVDDMAPTPSDLYCENDCDLTEYEMAVFEPIQAMEEQLGVGVPRPENGL